MTFPVPAAGSTCNFANHKVAVHGASLYQYTMVTYMYACTLELAWLFRGRQKGEREPPLHGNKLRLLCVFVKQKKKLAGL